MTITTERIYYDFSKVMSYDAVFNFIVGGRGIGKTFGANKDAITRALKRGEQFIYLRRFKEEISAVKTTFFNELQEWFPDYEFRVNGVVGEYKHSAAKKWKTICYFVSLSQAQKWKSSSFPAVTTIIFDEFILEKGHSRYLPNEAITFQNFYSTVDRDKDKTKVLFLANSVSITNPYFIEYDIEPKREFQSYANGFIVCHFVDHKHFNGQAYKSRFGQFIAETEYAKYAIENQFKDNDDRLLAYKTHTARYLFSLITGKGRFSVWYDMTNDEFHCQQKHPKDPSWFTTEPEQVDDSVMFLDRNHRIMQHVRRGFKQGRMYFDKPLTRNALTDIFKV